MNWGHVIAVVLLLIWGVSSVENGSMPEPWTTELKLGSEGKGVAIAQMLLNRDDCCALWLNASGVYENSTVEAVSLYQTANDLEGFKEVPVTFCFHDLEYEPPTGVFDATTASLLLKQHLADNYKDDGTIPPGFKYKVYIPVHQNRCIEVTATLMDANLKILHQFTVRLHGHNPASGEPCPGLNPFSSCGNTPTGLALFDLNAPEGDPKLYGPYPVNRLTQGLQGNAGLVESNLRDGILMHTGEWDHWDPSQPMPNSCGCIHGHPEDIKKVSEILQSIGVVVNPNLSGQLPYPFRPQGVISIEQID